MCWSVVDTICVCCLKYFNWGVLSCSVSQKPSRQAPPTGPQSGDRLCMGVLCVHQCVVCCVGMECNSEWVYTHSDVCTPHFADY